MILSARLFKILVLILLVYLPCSAVAGETTGKERVALFPFENFSGNKDAMQYIMPEIRGRLESSGFEVIDDASLDAFLLKERIRSTGYIAEDAAIKMGRELNVKGVVMGSINSFSTDVNPVVGLSARIVRTSDGSVVWANHASSTGEDSTTILELGTIREIERLSRKVLGDLFGSLTMHPPDKERESTYRIAVMPFENDSGREDAGMIATYLFLAELFKNEKFEPVEFGEVKRFTVAMRIRGKGELDYRNANPIAESAGVDGIVVGTVEAYREESGNSPPEASISARLIDARKNRILWCNNASHDGDDDIIILDWGRLRSAESVAHKAVTELVEDMKKVKWQ
ncbi:MAG: hypothetical protein AB1442_08295 [Nitrospirota bacterium]